MPGFPDRGLPYRQLTEELLTDCRQTPTGHSGKLRHGPDRDFCSATPIASHITRTKLKLFTVQTRDTPARPSHAARVPQAEKVVS
jgi:hypothetical protein